MNKIQPKNQGKVKKLIILLSVIVPLLVGMLYVLPKPENVTPEWRNFLNYLPRFNAIINGSTFVILLLALRAIKNKNTALHKKLMTTALVFSIFFLVSYVTYHITTASTHYGGEGTLKYIYFFVLLTHILLSAIIVPLVLITFIRALSEKLDKHRKIARITLPIWLYVTFTGVVVYWMISGYY